MAAAGNGRYDLTVPRSKVLSPVAYPCTATQLTLGLTQGRGHRATIRPGEGTADGGG